MCGAANRNLHRSGRYLSSGVFFSPKIDVNCVRRIAGTKTSKELVSIRDGLIATSSAHGCNHEHWTGNQRCALDHDWLRDGEGRSVRPIPELSEQPSYGCESDPADRPKPADHGHSHRSQEAYGEKPLLQRWWLDGILAGSQGFG
jgi:hypothetical protein